MKTIISRIGITGLILLSVFINAFAQESTTLQFMKGMPQSSLTNPALHNDSSLLVIGLPGLSGVYADFSSSFAVNDLIHKGTGVLADSLVMDIDGFHNSLKSTNSIMQHSSIPLLYMGFRSRKAFFSFGITEKSISRFSFDKSIVTFIKDGNAAYMGQNFDLGNLDFDAFNYSEFAFSYSNEFLKGKLSVGVTAKYLMGQSALQTERMNLKVETAADASYINLSSDMKVNISAPVTVEYDEDNYFNGMEDSDDIEPADYILQKGNSGMAFDLGAVYKLTPKITLSASIVDIGKIKFKENLTNLSHVSTYKWEGIDFSNSIDESQSNYVDPSDLVEDETDKLEDSFRPKKSEFSSSAFDVKLPTKVYLGGTYQINKNLNLGLLDCLYKNGEVSRNSITLSANALLGNFFSLSGSYSMIGNASNLGLGAALRLGFFQFYLASDNLMALADPAKAEFVSARFGVNLLFGRKHKVKTAETTENQ